VLGPAPFWEPITSWIHGRTTRARAVAALADRIRAWIKRLESSRAHPADEPLDTSPGHAALFEPDRPLSARLFGGH
jgi:hypothetical protein